MDILGMCPCYEATEILDGRLVRLARIRNMTGALVDDRKNSQSKCFWVRKFKMRSVIDAVA